MIPGIDPTPLSQRLENNSIALLLASGAVFILWLAALIDILRNEFKRDINKLVWFFTIIIPVLGPLLYLFIGFEQKIEEESEDTDFPKRRRRL